MFIPKRSILILLCRFYCAFSALLLENFHLSLGQSGIRLGRCEKKFFPGPHDVSDGLNSEIYSQCGMSEESRSSGS